jgi:hypothetical protein
MPEFSGLGKADGITQYWLEPTVEADEEELSLWLPYLAMFELLVRSS